MTKEQLSLYESPEALKEILKSVLYKRKFQLDCGHHITFNEWLGNDITIRNGKVFKITCAECGY